MFVKQGWQRFVDTAVAIVKAVFSFFQVHKEGVSGHTIEFHQTPLGIAPEAFNPVDVGIAPGKLIFAVVDPKVFVKADINQTVIAAPAVSVNHAGQIGFAPDDGLQDSLGGIGNNLCINAAAPLKQAKHHSLAACTPAAQAAYAAWAKVRLIGFQLTAQRRDLSTELSQTVANAKVNSVDRAH